MPRFAYNLKRSEGTVERAGAMWFNTPPRVGDPVFGTPGIVWNLVKILPSADHAIAGTLVCEPSGPTQSSQP